jgi:hypothetical protein
METYIILLLFINVYLLIDYILDNYYFNGTKKGNVLILNRHFFYEFFQIGLIGLLIVAQLFYLKDIPWYGWIMTVILITTWASRIYTTYKNRNCEIQIGENKIVYINNEGKTQTLENPNYISIIKVSSDRITIQSEAKDDVVIFRNEKKEELEINLYNSSLDSYVTQIYKSAIKNFGANAYEGVKPWRLLNLKKLIVSFIILILVFLVISYQPK